MLLKGDLNYMKTVKVSVIYNEIDSSISVNFDDDSLILISETKKELKAKEIYEMFKYENDKKYLLSDIADYPNIDEDDLYYLKECHQIFKNVIDGLEIPEE